MGTKRYADFLEERIQERLDQYRAKGVGTVIPLVPCFGPNAARLGTERLDPERIDWINERVRAVAKRNAGWVRLIDPESKLCDASGKALAATPDGIPLREDGSHFDPAGRPSGSGTRGSPARWVPRSTCRQARGPAPTTTTGVPRSSAGG